MPNAKQDGTNLINIEYSTSRCLTMCEQCFVNFGQQGTATCLGTFNPEREKSLAFIERVGQASGYVKAPKIPPGTKPPRGYELLLRRITRTGKGLWNVPTQAAQETWVTKPNKAACLKYDSVSGLESYGDFPIFLRVSSMSDTMRAPLPWIKQVHAAWGDHCFFSSAIRSVKWAVTHGHQDRLDAVHKIVVTMNPGKQTLAPFYARDWRAKSSKKRNRDRVKWSKRPGVSPMGRMGDPVDRPRDFFHPQSLTDLGDDIGMDLEDYESVIKFYRHRAFPTIFAEPETDRPIVVTQMRLISPAHAAEFARRYNLELHAVFHEDLFKQDGAPKAAANLDDFMPFLKLPHISMETAPSGPNRLLYLRSKKNDPRNNSPFAGEWTELEWRSSYYRVRGVHFDDAPYVCDRLHGSCKRCGLCATLDGTGPTVDGVPFCNELNEAPWGDLILPIPYREGAAYLGDIKDAEGGDYFRELMKQTQEAGGFERNPPEPDPADPEECIELLRSAGMYLDKGQEFDVDFVESWDTHEDATTAVAFAVWSLVSHAQAEGRTMDDVYDFVDRETEDIGIDVLEGVPELDGIWDGISSWNDQFGPTR
jgi:hypothetical protein